jgi:hypothetical protein
LCMSLWESHLDAHLQKPYRTSYECDGGDWFSQSTIAFFCSFLTVLPFRVSIYCLLWLSWEGFGAQNSLQIEGFVQLQHVLLCSYPTAVSFQKGQDQQQQQHREKKPVNLNTVISIILGGGASTHLDPLTFHRATPAVRSTTLLLWALFSISSFSGANWRQKKKDATKVSYLFSFACNTHTHTHTYTWDLDGHLFSDWRKISPPLGTCG